ncbi:hypothetical protein V8G54_012869 [Vigna mungo]|uniref:Prokaryotic-type class I peptide chain release factors domain-containing protein n=1 Tax=Vigna mungo TaxID=3915 RepID=A0AAQ3S3R5_VIGMU
MAHKTLFRPTFILTLHKMPILVSYRSFRPSQQQPFSFLNTHRIPLPATARTTSNTHTHLWCSNFSTNTTIEGSEKCYLYLTDDDLMRQCEMDTFKASGPGGQHRNKRESAVRLKHLPTGIIAQVFPLSTLKISSCFISRHGVVVASFVACLGFRGPLPAQEPRFCVESPSLSYCTQRYPFHCLCW